MIKAIIFMRRRLKVRVGPCGRAGTYRLVLLRGLAAGTVLPTPLSQPSTWPGPALNSYLLIFSHSWKKDRMRAQDCELRSEMKLGSLQMTSHMLHVA